MSSPEPPSGARSDARAFLAFAGGAVLLLIGLGLAFVVLLIVVLSSSPEAGRMPVVEAALMLLFAGSICVGLVAGGVFLIGYALRGRWPTGRELGRWTAVVVAVAAVAGLAPFFVR